MRKQATSQRKCLEENSGVEDVQAVNLRDIHTTDLHHSSESYRRVFQFNKAMHEVIFVFLLYPI